MRALREEGYRVILVNGNRGIIMNSGIGSSDISIVAFQADSYPAINHLFPTERSTMKKLALPAVIALLVGFFVTSSAAECNAQRVRNPWAFVAGDSYARLFFLKDSVVEEENHVRVSWIRITYKEVRQHGMATGYSPAHNVLEVRYRFDCPAHRVLQLESRERMGDTIVHEHPANPDAEWQRHNTNTIIRDVWRRLC